VKLLVLVGFLLSRRTSFGIGSAIGSNDDDNDYDVNEDCSNLWVVIGMPKSITLVN